MNLLIQSDMWDVTRAFWELAPVTAASLDERITLLETERELRALQVRYYDALDSGDLGALMALFHDESVHVGARGTFVGKDAIRQDYEHSFTLSRIRVHYATNTGVRITSEDEAWMTSRNYALVVRPDDRVRISAASVVWRLTKTGEEWLIIESRAAHLIEHVLPQ